jgi:hypothetical protein
MTNRLPLVMDDTFETEHSFAPPKGARISLRPCTSWHISLMAEMLALARSTKNASPTRRPHGSPCNPL